MLVTGYCPLPNGDGRARKLTEIALCTAAHSRCRSIHLHRYSCNRWYRLRQRRNQWAAFNVRVFSAPASKNPRRRDVPGRLRKQTERRTRRHVDRRGRHASCSVQTLASAVASIRHGDRSNSRYMERSHEPHEPWCTRDLELSLRLGEQQSPVMTT